MGWFTFRNNANSNVLTAERLLTRFGFMASADGVLRIRPVGPVLTYDELDTILKRVVEEHADRHVAEIVVDFGTVEWIKIPWTAVFAIRRRFWSMHEPAGRRIPSVHAATRRSDRGGVFSGAIPIHTLVDYVAGGLHGARACGEWDRRP